jgi:general secretion pathway protein A
MRTRARAVPADPTRAFQPTADRGALWLSGQYDDAVRMLRAGVLGDRGLLALVGEPGTGKTVLTYALADRLSDDAVVVARLKYPIVEGVDVLAAIAEAFGLPSSFEDRAGFVETFRRFAADAAAAGRHALLIVDGAETLNAELLLELGRLPYESGADGPALISVLIVGPRAVLDALRAGGMEPATLCYVRPLTREQTGEYIAHRLRTAGHRRQLFTPTALRKIWVVSDGIPRVINTLCIDALTVLQQLGRHRATAAMIDRSARPRRNAPARETPPEPATATTAPITTPRTRSSRRLAWVAAALAIGFGVGAIGSATPIGRALLLTMWSNPRASSIATEAGWGQVGATIGRADPLQIVSDRVSDEPADDKARGDGADAAVRSEPPPASSALPPLPAPDPPAIAPVAPVVSAAPPVTPPVPRVVPPAAKTPVRPDAGVARTRPRDETPPSRAPQPADDRDDGAVIDWVLGKGRTATGNPFRE